ncbi:SusC/RagA family TonB-linked outer membrane protein [Mucilaginibacter sp. NFX135]|uniref:SusC/RagA family TonB-linked outer membrane protein n=1 Tax=Mucilaginibacter sp. NFX135 TaxID=3402687 RepID=UPI003AFA18CF
MKKTIFFMVLATLCLFFKLPAQEISPQFSQTLSGKVTDEQGKPLPGATVLLQGTRVPAITSADGTFKLFVTVRSGTLTVSFIGFPKASIPFEHTRAAPLSIQLTPDLSALNEVQVIGYGTTTKRFNTGSVASISAKEIENQPVSNPLAALQGRASGVLVQTTNGLPGGGIKVQIRGQGSLASGTDPLFIVDGVPFLSTSPYGSGALNGANGIISPLSIINPDDIESIDILKDADATAIYGSRAANGVVLITTKKGKKGGDRVTIDLSHGISKISRISPVLGLSDYLKLRREAFSNDGITPDINTAPDLLKWDTAKSTDWQRYFYGKTAQVTTLQTSIAGGNDNNQYLFSLNYRNEGTILPGDENYKKGGGYFNFNHSSTDQRFNFALSVNYNKDNNHTLYSAINSGAFSIPPNFPVRNSDGSYNWDISNPVAALEQKQRSNTDYINVSTSLGYKLFPGMDAKISLGYNRYALDQVATLPQDSQDPSFDPLPTAYFSNSVSQRYILEPQLNYRKEISGDVLTALIGGTFQHVENTGYTLEGDGVSNPALLGNLGAANTIVNQINTYSLYKYVSIFGRVNYNRDKKYLININFRRDGSSRFGPGKQFGNFYAIGGAWIFTEENGIKRSLPFLSHGKLRGSYGTTGNDQISDYQYISSYNAGTVYGGTSTLSPARVANPDYSWETTRKLEAALELGFIHDRILFTTAWYRHNSSKQLIAYKIPYLAGFASYQANFPAVIQNTGLELDLKVQALSGKGLNWTSTINLTLPKNKLKSFPNIEGSSYANTYIVGQDLSVKKGLKLLGVDPQTGIAQFADINNDGKITTPADLVVLGKTSPDLFGGWTNSFSYKGFALDVTMEFVKRRYLGYQPLLGAYPYNDPLFVLNRWQKPGDVTDIPRASVNIVSSQYNSTQLPDASYGRLKNLAISYTPKAALLKRLGLKGLQLYINGQNLWVIANKQRFDPEISGGSGGVAPLKSIIFGLKTTL